MEVAGDLKECIDRILNKDSIDLVYAIAKRNLNEDTVRTVCMFFACISTSPQARRITRILVGDTDEIPAQKKKKGYMHRVSVVFLVGFARRVAAKYGDEHYLTRLCVLVSHLYSWRHHSFWHRAVRESPMLQWKPDDALLHMDANADIVDFYGTFRVVFG
jgi:hypothetical protein